MNAINDGSRIVCAALKADDGEIIVGIRHFSSDMRKQIKSRPDGKKFYRAGITQQGFVNQYGDFLTRTEAWRVAEKRGQIFRRVCGDDIDGGTLFSENLY